MAISEQEVLNTLMFEREDLFDLILNPDEADEGLEKKEEVKSGEVEEDDDKTVDLQFRDVFGKFSLFKDVLDV